MKTEKENTATLPARAFEREADQYCFEDSTDADCTIHREELGITPLHQAAFNGSIKKVKELLDGGIDVNIADKKGYRPLHDAAMQGHVEIVKLLLDAGADPNVQDDEYGYTPLHDAVRMNHVGVVGLLLSSGVHRSLKNRAHETALDIAKEYKFHNIIYLFSLFTAPLA